MTTLRFIVSRTIEQERDQLARVTRTLQTPSYKPRGATVEVEAFDREGGKRALRVTITAEKLPSAQQLRERLRGALLTNNVEIEP